MVLCTVVVEIVVAAGIMIGFARVFRLGAKLTALLAIGSSVCGVSAIIATQGAIDADEIPATEAMVQGALEAAADLFAEPHLSLRLPADLPLRRYGLAELAARSTPTEARPGNAST